MDIITRKEAKKLGLKYYFTGKPCKYGHIAIRLTTNWDCLECNKKYKKNYYYKNKESIISYNIAYNKKLWEECPQIKRSYDKKYREQNPEKRIKYLRKQKSAIPQWHETDLVKQLYLKRDQLSKLWNISLHVDHVVPLQGKNVCGLHCWDNLQLLEASLNISKHNKFKE